MSQCVAPCQRRQRRPPVPGSISLNFNRVATGHYCIAFIYSAICYFCIQDEVLLYKLYAQVSDFRC